MWNLLAQAPTTQQAIDAATQAANAAQQAVDALKEVNAWYDSSLTRLLVVMGAVLTVGFFVVGVIVPYHVNRLQSRSFEATEKQYEGALDEAEKRHDKTLQEALTKAESRFNADLTEFRDQLKEEAEGLKQEMEEVARQKAVEVESTALTGIVVATSVDTMPPSQYLILCAKAAFASAKAGIDYNLRHSLERAIHASKLVQKRPTIPDSIIQRESVRKTMHNLVTILTKEGQLDQYRDEIDFLLDVTKANENTDSPDDAS